MLMVSGMVRISFNPVPRDEASAMPVLPLVAR